KSPSAGIRDQRVFLASYDKHRTLNAPGEGATLVYSEPVVAIFSDRERFTRCLEAPADGVLGRFGRVRLGEHLRHEEFDECRVVAQPLVLVVLSPALIGVQLVSPLVDTARGQRDASALVARPNEYGGIYPVRMLSGENQPPVCPQGEADNGRALRSCR